MTPDSLDLSTPSIDLKSLKRVAFSMSNAIGDSLVSMIIVRHLQLSGVDVTVFGAPANALREWFPDVEVFPRLNEETLAEQLAPFDTVFQMQWNQPLPGLRTAHPRVVTLHDVEFGDRQGCMAERFVNYCRDQLAIAGADLDNGMRAPRDLVHRRNMKRVVIHPEASTEDKRWLSARFVKLAARLKARGYDPVFVIAPHERERWSGLSQHGISAPVFETIGALASYVYESGWFIGNDSGVGHLASNLGIPAVSLFRRRRVAERWRPAWGATRVVLPWQWVPTAYLKEKFWRQTITCSRVLAAFDRLRQRELSAADRRSIL